MAVGAILSTGAARRIVQLGPDLLLLSYLQPALLRPGGTVRQLEGIETTWFDVGADSSATRAAALSDTGELWTLEAGGEARSLGLFASASAVDVTSDGGAVLGEKGALVVVAPDGQVRRLTQGEALVVDLAVSPGDRWAAVGGLDGVVRVVDLETGATRAVLEGHRERVASLAWTGPEALLSSSWDGTVRVWDLSVLHRPAEQLVAEARTAWGLDLDAALEAVGP
jgi:hypothetical protein